MRPIPALALAAAIAAPPAAAPAVVGPAGGTFAVDRLPCIQQFPRVAWTGDPFLVGYETRLGTPFLATQDTEALATCP